MKTAKIATKKNLTLKPPAIFFEKAVKNYGCMSQAVKYTKLGVYVRYELQKC